MTKTQIYKEQNYCVFTLDGRPDVIVNVKPRCLNSTSETKEVAF